MGALQDYVRGKDHHPNLKLQYLQKLIEKSGELAKAMRKDIRYAGAVACNKVGGSGTGPLALT